MTQVPQDQAGASARKRGASAPSPWRRVNRMMVFAIFLGVLGIIGAKFWPEVEKLNHLQVRTQALEIREAQLRLTRDRLREESIRLKEDPEYFELVVRDRLDLMRSGETVYRFVNRPASH